MGGDRFLCSVRDIGETCALLQEAYSEECFAKQTMQHWHKSFRDGHQEAGGLPYSLSASQFDYGGQYQYDVHGTRGGSLVFLQENLTIFAGKLTIFIGKFYSFCRKNC